MVKSSGKSQNETCNERDIEHKATFRIGSYCQANFNIYSNIAYRVILLIKDHQLKPLIAVENLLFLRPMNLGC